MQRLAGAQHLVAIGQWPLHAREGDVNADHLRVGFLGGPSAPLDRPHDFPKHDLVLGLDSLVDIDLIVRTTRHFQPACRCQVHFSEVVRAKAVWREYFALDDVPVPVFRPHTIG